MTQNLARPKKFYTVKEASIILGFSTNSIYKFVDTNRLKSSRGNSIKGRIRITKKALEDFIGHEITDEQIEALLAPTRPRPKPQPRTVHAPTPVTEDPSPSHTFPIPINITRGLIILSLIFILADLISMKF